MILYYSATGNTEWVARRLSALLVDKHICSMQELVERRYAVLREMREGEPLGILFPVHAWGVPAPVRRVIQDLPEWLVTPYIYMVCTCGDDIGYTAGEFSRLMAGRSRVCRLFCSVCMPESYVGLPGFDVDTLETEERKLAAAEVTVGEIARRVKEREEGSYVKEGAFPGWKSGFLRACFNRFLVTDRYFHVTESCVGCGKCARSCPESNIRMEEHPVWTGSGRCTTCMACYHTCPYHAIRLGWFTGNKGQYLHPDK